MEYVQKRPMKMVKGLEDKTDEEQLRSLDLFTWRKRRMRGDFCLQLPQEEQLRAEC